MQDKGKKSLFIMMAILIFTMIMALLAIESNNLYNNKTYTCDVENGQFSGEHISVYLDARGAGTGQIAAWPYEAEYVEKDGTVTYKQMQGVIYDATLTNKTDKAVAYWEFDVYMPEMAYLNSGWNGMFDIHQGINSDNPNTFKTSTFHEPDMTLEFSYTRDCMLIPLDKSDYFTYTPDAGSNEIPIDKSDLKNDDLSGKTVGFILYHETSDNNYVMSFPKVTVRYRLHRELLDNRGFQAVLAVFILWLMVAVQIGIVHVRTKRIIREKDKILHIMEDTMNTFIEFIDAKDEYTKGHSLRVARYSRLIGEKLGFNEEDCNNIYYTALLHDCGKISIPQYILTKPGKLTVEEYEIMKSHAEKGYSMLRKFKSVPDIELGAYCHHERYDGKGYPQGLAGEDIPLIGRIIGVADAYDAMNSKRCYRDRFSREYIIEEIVTNSGTQFDPKIAELFVKLINSGEVEGELLK